MSSDLLATPCWPSFLLPDASRLLFVVEFVRGDDLMNHMQRKLRFSQAEAQFYSAEISLALNYLHGIIYRDVKLDNVLLDFESL